MKKCKHCGKEINENSVFCSSSCSATFNNKNRKPHSEETKQRISGSVKNWVSNLKENDPTKYEEYRKRQAEASLKRYGNKEERDKIRITKLLVDNFSELGEERKRKRIILEQNGKCLQCGISEWRGVPITLEMDHIDGNRFNNNRENLVCICPNCHSITPTFRAKNKKTTSQVTDEMLTDALKKEVSIRQALIAVGLSAKGGNYIRAKELKKSIDKTDRVVKSILE